MTDPMKQDQEITPGAVFAPPGYEKVAVERTNEGARQRVSDSAPVQVETAPLSTSSEPASGTPNAQNAG